ncbi:MAG: BrnT family toxin [Devosia sp.]|nr:BrnT family toxin [Devosia sp.]
MEWDETKRQWTRDHRGLDFADVINFEMATAEHQVDHRRDYGEVRFVSTGLLHDRLCVLCWTLRDGQLRVISLRKANDREKKDYRRIRG